jgi:DNA recombination protein RmuC
VRAQTELFEARVLAATAKLMEDSSRSLAERNQKDVTAVVAPFKEQLAEFRQRVDHIYATDTHERGSLKAQIETLTSMNQAMSVQAQRLANALTVTSKSVGDWGETILGKILEDSGLRKGHEYELQVSISGRSGESLRPDAVIRLPESRQLIVDSKVSNKAWTEYCAAVDEVEKETRLREHLLSLRAHMKGLSGKAYTDSPELSTVDFVLMFVPVEAALLTAFVKDPDLYADAYRSRIVLVTPSTLMAVIKLVEGIWTFQKRKESADEIAEAGRKLYEKLTNFAASFISVGRAIKQSSDAFEQAQGQLSTGKGNAIKLAEDMKKLGVTPAAGKTMPAQLLLPNQDEDD